MRRYFSFFVTILFLVAGFLSGGFVTAAAVHVAPTPNMTGSMGDHMWFLIASDSLSRHEREVRKAAVKVSQANGYGSGTYFKWKGHHIVLTAAHVVDGMTSAQIVERDGAEVTGRVIYQDDMSDLAVLVLPHALRTRDPMTLRLNKDGGHIGLRVFYTGHPNGNDLMSLEGRVAAYAPFGRYYIQGFAWFGASGSGVFDHRGKLVGVLTALDLVMYDTGPAPLEDVVVVVPISKLNFKVLEDALDDMNPVYYALPVRITDLLEGPEESEGAPEEAPEESPTE